jgi:hypothetical protein
VPGSLRSCANPVKAPAPVPAIPSSPVLRAGYDAEHNARLQDQAAAIACGRTLAEVILLVDAFNLVHGPH